MAPRASPFSPPRRAQARRATPQAARRARRAGGGEGGGKGRGGRGAKGPGPPPDQGGHPRAQEGVAVEEGEEGEAGPPREEEEEEGVLHQGQGLEEEEEVDPPHPEGEGPQVGGLEDPLAPLPGPRPEGGVREVQKAV